MPNFHLPRAGLESNRLIQTWFCPPCTPPPVFNCILGYTERRVRIGVWAQSTLGGARHFCPKNMYEKLTKCPNFTWLLPEKLSKYPNFMIFAQKINKILEFYTIFARILHNNCPKNIFPEFWGYVPPLLPSPTESYSYAYMRAAFPWLHQIQNGCACFRALWRSYNPTPLLVFFRRCLYIYIYSLHRAPCKNYKKIPRAFISKRIGVIFGTPVGRTICSKYD